VTPINPGWVSPSSAGYYSEWHFASSFRLWFACKLCQQFASPWGKWKKHCNKMMITYQSSEPLSILFCFLVITAFIICWDKALYKLSLDCPLHVAVESIS